MIPFDYKKIDSASEFNTYEYADKAAEKAFAPSVQDLASCTERDDVELFFVNVEKSTVPIWASYDIDGDIDGWWVLVDKEAKNIVTVSDFKEGTLKNRNSFVAQCKKLKLYMKSYKEVKINVRKASGEFKNLGFDPAKIDKLWRNEVYKHKKMKPEEVKALANACKKIIDMLSKKNNAGSDLGLLYARLVDAAGIPVK